jgi:uncharacterized protein YndB with AHSA1/START domain
MTVDIDRSAPVQARHEITINAPVETVWRLLTEIDTWPQWNPAITRSKLDGPIRSGAKFKWKAGGASLVSTLHDVEPKQYISWTGRALGIRAIHIWRLRPLKGGVNVVTQESFTGLLATLLSGILQRTLDSTLQKWLHDLKKTAEASL